LPVEIAVTGTAVTAWLVDGDVKVTFRSAPATTRPDTTRRISKV
jgi:hypothetical protein